jgi:hypothetical protein
MHPVARVSINIYRNLRTQQMSVLVVGGVVFYAVRVTSTKSGRLILHSNSCYYIFLLVLMHELDYLYSIEGETAENLQVTDALIV